MDEESESSEDLDYEPPEKDDASHSDGDSGDDRGSNSEKGSDEDVGGADSEDEEQPASSDDENLGKLASSKLHSKDTGSKRRNKKSTGNAGDDSVDSRGTSQRSDIRPPKRPLTAYISFTKVQSSKFKGMNFKEVTVLLSTRWKAMSEEEKKPYMEMAAAEKKRYEKEMSEFSRSQEGQLYEKMKKDRRLKLQSGKKNKSLTEDQKHGRGEKRKKSLKSGSDKKFSAPASEGIGVTSQMTESSEPIDPFQVPIFNQRFLEFNKKREAKLRQLRRACGDVESENAELETHMKALNSMISRSEQDAVRLFAHAQMLAHQMNSLKASVIHKLHTLPSTSSLHKSKTLNALLEKESEIEADEFLGELNKIVMSSEVDLSSRQAIKSVLKKVSYPKDDERE